MRKIENKFFKIDKDTIQSCSFEEILEKYKPLIISMINYWKTIESAEIQQICYISLWKAFETYDLSKNITFGSYAKKIMINGIYQLIKKDNKINYISLNYPIANTNTQENFIANTQTNTSDLEDAILTKLIINEYIPYLEEKYQKIFDLYYIKGYTQKQIAKLYNLTQPAINYRINELKCRLQKCWMIDTVKNLISKKYRQDILKIYITNSLYDYIKYNDISKLQLIVKELSLLFDKINTSIISHEINYSCVNCLKDIYLEINNYIEELQMIEQSTYLNIQTY